MYYIYICVLYFSYFANDVLVLVNVYNSVYLVCVHVTIRALV